LSRYIKEETSKRTKGYQCLECKKENAFNPYLSDEVVKKFKEPE